MANTIPPVSFVPTPIGNLGDITLRAIETLKTVDVIACEDTRHSRPLLNHFDIQKPLISLHQHNEMKRADELISRTQQGEKIAVISDAGMPAVSDPGYRIMQACLDAGIEYTVLPGASAVMTALVGSGFSTHAFSFDGFLPVKKGKRSKALQAALDDDRTSLFFESPHRLHSTLEILTELAPDKVICIARELSKKFETYHRSSSSELFLHFQQSPAKGEIVLIIPPTA